MGKIKIRTKEIFDSFDKHNDMFKLIEDIVSHNVYTWAPQVKEYNEHIMRHLTEIKKDLKND